VQRWVVKDARDMAGQKEEALGEMKVVPAATKDKLQKEVVGGEKGISVRTVPVLGEAKARRTWFPVKGI